MDEAGSARRTTITPLGENIYAVEAPCGSDIDVRALLVCGEQYSLLIDTLLRPGDLDTVRALVESRNRPLLIVNSHADWDHWFGNAAFPEAPVIAHRLTRQRQITEGKRSLAAQRRREPATFAGVVLRPATIAFESGLEIDLGGLHVELIPLPGHTRDCIVALIPERRLLFAGDAAEDPIPLLNERTIGDWLDRLLALVDRVTTVIPAHGRVSGPELLERNARYLRNLTERSAAAVPELAGAPAFYRQAHRRHVRAVGRLPER